MYPIPPVTNTFTSLTSNNISFNVQEFSRLYRQHSVITAA